MQPSALVFDAVAGEVDQEQIVKVAVGEEAFDLLTDHPRRLIEQSVHVEPADGGVAQYPGERVDVVDRCPQPAQLRVVIVGGRDQQRGLTPRHRR